MQKLTIHPGTSDLWLALRDLFGEKGGCGGCWCMYWRIGKEYRRRSQEANRADLHEVVTPPGLIAFDGELAVGWSQLTSRALLPVLDRGWPPLTRTPHPAPRSSIRLQSRPASYTVGTAVLNSCRARPGIRVGLSQIVQITNTLSEHGRQDASRIRVVRHASLRHGINSDPMKRSEALCTELRRISGLTKRRRKQPVFTLLYFRAQRSRM